jgi:hypothetical protein
MSKAISYYDWTLGFKTSDDKKPKLKKPEKKREINSIGIAEDAFKEYIKKWRTEHLS